jgi:putative two-component system response regulator
MQVLVIDDSRSSLALLTKTISEVEDCQVEGFLLPSEALQRADEHQFDLVVVDNIMPEMDGMIVTDRLRAMPGYRMVPIIMVTSDMDAAVRLNAIGAGANDFINKPFDTVELQARVRNLLALRQAQLELADRANWLATAVEDATRKLARREEEVIWRLARAIEYRDGDTGGHVSRVAMISRIIARGLGLEDERCHVLYLAAPLHDIGKIGIADAILGKPGKLLPEEFSMMQKHVAIGAKILEDGSSDLVRVAERVARYHHERWDGTGYPDRLAGEAIPLEARIVAVADVFDALTSQRPYKAAWPVEEAYAEILRGRGAHFDPACVDAFVAGWPEIEGLLKLEIEPLLAAG